MKLVLLVLLMSFTTQIFCSGHSNKEIRSFLRNYDIKISNFDDSLREYDPNSLPKIQSVRKIAKSTHLAKSQIIVNLQENDNFLHTPMVLKVQVKKDIPFDAARVNNYMTQLCFQLSNVVWRTLNQFGDVASLYQQLSQQNKNQEQLKCAYFLLIKLLAVYHHHGETYKDVHEIWKTAIRSFYLFSSKIDLSQVPENIEGLTFSFQMNEEPLDTEEVNEMFETVQREQFVSGPEFPERTFDETQLEEKSIEAACGICQENNVIVLKCGHQFHEGCLSDWATRDDSCPLCKAKFPTKKRPQTMATASQEMNSNDSDSQ